jgi:hypothetical protein
MSPEIGSTESGASRARQRQVPAGGAGGSPTLAATLGLEPRAVERMLATRVEAAVHRPKPATRADPGAGTAGDAVPFAA